MTKYKPTTDSITTKALKQLLEQGKDITKLDATSFAIGLAIEHRVNANTVDRCRRRYIASLARLNSFNNLNNQ